MHASSSSRRSPPTGRPSPLSSAAWRGLILESRSLAPSIGRTSYSSSLFGGSISSSAGASTTTRRRNRRPSSSQHLRLRRPCRLLLRRPPLVQQPPWPYPPAPVFHFPTPAPPPPYFPPSPTPGGQYAHGPTPSPSPNKGTLLAPFVGKSVSAHIIGNNFGTEPTLTAKHCACAISRKNPARGHRLFEFPLRYWALRGFCPG
jgi:hypothetical protein